MKRRALLPVLVLALVTLPVVSPAAAEVEREAGAATAADRPAVWFPLGPGSEATIFSKATTSDPFELRTSGPTGIDFVRISVEPGGTTGLMSRPGLTVTSIVEGAATVMAADAGTCASRTVNAGSAFIQPNGSGTEIRNDGNSPLDLYAVTFAPTEPAAAPLAAGPCAASAPAGAAVVTLTWAVVEAPLSAESKGRSDVYVGAVRIAGHGSSLWHTQNRPVFGGVDRGTVTLEIAHSDRCETSVLPAGVGFLEPQQMVHLVRNEASTQAVFYYVLFSASPQPLIAPAPSPKDCQSS